MAAALVGSQGSGPSTPMGGANKALAKGSSQSVPTAFALAQNYPNPFNPTTTINYDLPVDMHVTLKVYDVLGKEVGTLVDADMKGGYHQVTFDGSKLSSGVYLYRMQARQIDGGQAGHFVALRKTLLVK